MLGLNSECNLLLWLLTGDLNNKITITFANGLLQKLLVVNHVADSKEQRSKHTNKQKQKVLQMIRP